MSRLTLASGLVLLGLFALLGTASAQEGWKQTWTEATFLNYDPDAKTITVRVRRTEGSRRMTPSARGALRRGDEAAFKVSGGSAPAATVVRSRAGARLALDDLRPGARVRVSWTPDAQEASARLARSISVYVQTADSEDAAEAQLPASPE